MKANQCSWPYLAATLVALALFAASCGQGPAPGANLTVLEGVTLLDGTGAPALENAVLLIEGERVRAAGPAGQVEVPAGARKVNLSGKFIIPGLINAHGHVGGAKGMDSSPSVYTEENVVAQLERYLTYGVTAVMSLGSDQPLMYELRARQREGDLPGARVYTAGRGMMMKGSYGPAVIARAVETPEDVREQMREIAADRPDATKVWVDDGFGEQTKIRPELYRAFIEAAHEHGLKAYAHVYYLEDARALVEAGIDVLAHSIRDREVDDAFVKLAAERGVFLLPTLAREVTTFIYADPPGYLEDPFLTRHEDAEVVAALGSDDFVKTQRSNPHLAKYKAGLEVAKKNLKKLHDGGVPIGFATDSGPAGRIQGYLEHLELELMVEAGLLPAEAIAAATGGSARCMGVESDIGTLVAGRQADFVVLDASPLEDIKNSRKIASVWQRGVQVRGAILASLASLGE